MNESIRRLSGLNLWDAVRLCTDTYTDSCFEAEQKETKLIHCKDETIIRLPNMGQCHIVPNSFRKYKIPYLNLTSARRGDNNILISVRLRAQEMSLAQKIRQLVSSSLGFKVRQFNPRGGKRHRSRGGNLGAMKTLPVAGLAMSPNVYSHTTRGGECYSTTRVP